MKKLSNILFIDDDEITCYLNKSIVEEMQVAKNIVCLDDEQQALDFLKLHCAKKSAGDEDCPELIFLDLNMPFLNAFEFLESLKNYPEVDINRLFIVLLTSSWHARDIEKAKDYKVQGYLNKPLTREKLQDILLRFDKHSLA